MPSARKLLRSFLGLALPKNSRALEIQSKIRLLASENVINDDERASQLVNEYPHFPPILSHSGTPSSTNEPLFTYANRAALDLFGYQWDEFIGIPSKFSAKGDARGSRVKMMEKARDTGIIVGYEGERVQKSGNIFRIKNGIIWNLVDDGKVTGQAALLPDVVVDGATHHYLFK